MLNVGEQSFATHSMDTMPLPMEACHAMWTAPIALPCRHQWHLPHFESLQHFGQGNEGVFTSDWGPVLERTGNVSVLQTTTANMSVLDNIKSANKLGIPTDGFLSGVF